jgi:hypothetical protein
MVEAEHASALARAKARFLAFAKAAARVNAAIIFTLAYFLILGPARLIGLLAGADLLSIRRRATTGWVPRPKRSAAEILEGAG